MAYSGMLRGLVIVVMAIDHVRDSFLLGAVQDPMADPNITVGLFATRWITHFCAPVFVLLAGVSAGLMSSRKNPGQMARFLFTRGLWLIFAEIFIVSTLVTFSPAGIAQLGGLIFTSMQLQPAGIVATLMDFLNTTKYPPSLDYLLMTLGPAAILCSYADRMAGPVKDALVMFGHVLFAFYVAHFLLIHILSLILGVLQGFTASQMMTAYRFFPTGYWVHHPRLGDFLIDAGFDVSFAQHPPYGNYSGVMKLFNWFNGVTNRQQPAEDLEAQLKRMNVHPKAVFFTHLHPDHTAGVPALGPETELVFGSAEAGFLARAAVWNHLSGKTRFFSIDFTAASAMAPLGHSVDLFGDGSFWAISVPGHTDDDIAYLVNGVAPILLTGDASHFSWAFRNGVGPRGWDRAGTARGYGSLDQLRAFARAWPNVTRRLRPRDPQDAPLVSPSSPICSDPSRKSEGL